MRAATTSATVIDAGASVEAGASAAAEPFGHARAAPRTLCSGVAGKHVTERDLRTSFVSGDDLLALVNRSPQGQLAPDWSPTDLVDLRTGQATAAGECDKVQCLRKEAAGALGELLGDMKKRGFPGKVESAYRGYGVQCGTFLRWAGKGGFCEATEQSALPGHSQHQLGTTVDLFSEEWAKDERGVFREGFGCTPGGQVPPGARDRFRLRDAVPDSSRRSSSQAELRRAVGHPDQHQPEDRLPLRALAHPLRRQRGGGALREGASRRAAPARRTRSPSSNGSARRRASRRGSRCRAPGLRRLQLRRMQHALGAGRQRLRQEGRRAPPRRARPPPSRFERSADPERAARPREEVEGPARRGQARGPRRRRDAAADRRSRRRGLRARARRSRSSRRTPRHRRARSRRLPAPGWSPSSRCRTTPASRGRGAPASARRSSGRPTIARTCCSRRTSEARR